MKQTETISRIRKPLEQSPGESSHVEPSASLRFQNAVDGILNQNSTDEEFRDSLLLAAVQHAGFVGAAWYRRSDTGISVVTEFLEHPALQHEFVRQAIRDQAQVSAQQRRELIVPHTVVRNLTQISAVVPRQGDETEVVALLAADWTAQHRESGVHAARSVTRAATLRSIREELQTVGVKLRTTAALLELTSRIEAAQTLNEACRILADSVQEHLHCRFVAVGTKAAARLTCRVTAVAGIAEFDPRSNRTRRLKAALDESLVREDFSSWPAVNVGDDHQTMAHRQLAETHQVDVVASIPLKDSSDHVVGAIVVGGAQNLMTSDAVQFLRTLDLPAGTALSAVRRAQGGLLTQCVRKCRSTKGRTSALAALLLIAVTTGVMLIPIPYRVACSFRCEPVQSHFTVAPYDGVLETTLVKPGDTVTAGQLLARMEGREIRWELAGLAADTSRADKERDVHLADERIADSIMAGLEVDRLTSRRELLSSRLEQLEIRSPVNGIVLSGSLNQKQNFPVEVGQKLYEVAPLSPLRMELAVSDVDIDHVREGMPVAFRADSHPTQLVHGTVERIRPRSETINERNVFVAEVTLQNGDGRLRPGMTGVARIKSDSHPIGWNLFHKAWEYTVSRVLW